MSGRLSSSQPSVGSGALSHAYIQHPSLRCNVPESRGLFYDDANRLLICVTSSSQVFFSFTLKWFIDFFCLFVSTIIDIFIKLDDPYPINPN